MFRSAMSILVPVCIVQAGCTQAGSEFWLNHLTAIYSSGYDFDETPAGPDDPDGANRGTPPTTSATGAADPATPRGTGLPSSSSGARRTPTTTASLAGRQRSGSVAEGFVVTPGVTLPVEPDGSGGTGSSTGGGSGMSAMEGPGYSPGGGGDG